MKQFSVRTFSIIAVHLLMNGEIQALAVKGPSGYEPAIAPAGISDAPTGFEENKGQVRTTAGEAAPFVRYRLTQGNTSIFLLDNGIAYQFNRTHYPEGYATLERDVLRDPTKQQELDALRKEIRLETYRMDILLEGANAGAEITKEGRSADYTQYYNHDALDVHTYTRVTYHEVYPGIDWVIYTTEKGMKYDFVLQPGADPTQIQLRFMDHEELYVNADGQLIHGNPMGRFTEDRPVSFQNGKEVHTRFLLEGDRLRFALGEYDPSQRITIDPARIWGTYYGGTGSDESRQCAVDASGNVYLAGTTSWSTTAIGSGGHQNMYGGGDADAFLVKFNANGVRQWATYYGGPADDNGSSCAIDASGNVYLAGYTSSTTAIANGGHDNTLGGTIDAFLVKFNASGVRQWATYYGGPADDNGSSCAVDADGNVYLAGTTYSTTAIASGGHQNTIGGGGPFDAFLVKFNASGVRQWGTYYGGTGSDSASCAVDASGNVYLLGVTTSGTGIAIGGHQNTHGGGGYDAYLVKFNASGVRQWGTYYGGTEYDAGSSCAVDASGNVYLSGFTSSTTAIASGGHQNMFGGGNYDAFLVKFNASGVRQWGTYYGGTGDEWWGSCAVDDSGNVYLPGTTPSTTAIASGGHQNTQGGARDAFLVKFDDSAVRQWGTYYGGASDDFGNSCAVDASGNVYLAGYTSSTTAIGSGGHQNTIGGSYDAFLVKFDAGSAGCSYSLAPTANPNVPNTGANNLTVSVFAGIGCAWTAVSNDPAMITITSGSPGNGDSMVTYDVSANTGSSTRVGSFSVQGTVFQVTQEGSTGCAYSFSPTSNPSVPSGGATNLSVTINTGTGCIWTATNDTPAMITIVSGSSGSGSGPLTYNVSSNPGSTTRSGSITVQGVTFQITQAGSASFAYTVTASAQPENGTFPSAIPLAVQPHLKICADGSRATILRVTASDALANMSVIRMRMKHGNGDSGFSGVFEMGYDTTEATTTTRFTHPTYAITVPGASFRSDTLEVYNQNAPSVVLASVPVRFYRTPIAFLHGFGGSAATFQPMANNLVSTGMYPSSFDLSGGSPLLYRAGYGARSLLPLSVNRKVVPNAIRTTLGSAITAGYSCGKATIIAHSMGGLLSRNYLGGYNGVAYLGDISRLITVSSPHYGTQLANYCTPPLPWQAPNECSAVYGAIGLLPVGITIGSAASLIGSLVSLSAARDMKVDADPILRLNTWPQTVTVPSVTLATDETGDANGTASFVRSMLSGALDPDDENIYDSEEHDLVVPMSSQQSGMQLQGIVQQQWHIGSSANGGILSQVRTLLDLDPSSPAFSQSGFVQNTLVYSMPAGAGDELSAGASRSAGQLNIVSPSEGQVFAPNDMVTVVLEYSSEVTTMSMSVIANGFDPIVMESASVSQFQFQVPANAIGNLGIYVLGGDGTGWVASDATFITVMSPMVPDSIRATPGSLVLPLGVSDYVAVEGYYGSNEPIDLIDAPSMTMMIDPAFLEYHGQGEFRALALGQTYVAFNYLGALDTTYFTIVDDPAALLAAFDYSDPVICAGGSVAFTDVSQGLVANYQWSFPGGQPLSSSDPAPTVTYPIAGSYPVKLVTTFVNGVDSLELEGLVVVQDALNAVVIDGGNTLSASVDNAFYQWLDCMNNGEPIPGATTQDFTPVVNGHYAVRVIAGACVDTSDCFAFIGNSMGRDAQDGGFRILPNPNNGRFAVLLPHLEGQVRYVVTDVAGQVIWSESVSGVTRWAFELNESPGLYFMDVYSERGKKTLKLMKQ